MKRTAVIKKLKKAAKENGLAFSMRELTNHTEVRIGKTSRTLARHSEIDDIAAKKYFAQFQNELGKGWWRK